MPTINPYLNFQGNAKEAFIFYQSIFSGEFIGGITRFSDTPEGDNLPENERDKVMHIALPIGDRNVIMGTDALESMNQTVEQGNNFLFLSSPTTKSKPINISTAFLTKPKSRWRCRICFGVITSER
jgi:PhnB protein